MVSICPYCNEALNLNEVQKEKVEVALRQVTTGVLKMGCPHCRKIMQLRCDGSLLAQDQASDVGKKRPEQPAYPDISWLASGMYHEQENIQDIPKVLLIMPDGMEKQTVSQVFEDIGYQVESAESSSDAIAKMRFVTFESVVLHSTMEGSLAKSTLHNEMRAMPMDKRRYVYYILVGPEFHTLYDLEALSNSANLVINDSEIENFEIILRKGLRDYDELFGPYMSALKENS